MALPFQQVLRKILSSNALDSAKNGVGIYDPARFFSDEQQAEAVNRLAHYATLRNAYNGGTMAPVSDDGDTEIIINFNRAFVNKSVDWLFNEMWQLECPAGNEAITDEVMKVLDSNSIHQKCWKMAHSGAITGDGFIMAYVDDTGNPRNPMSGKIRVTYLKPQFVHPVFHPFDHEEVVAVLIQWPVSAGAALQTRYGLPSETYLYSQLITTDKIYEYADSKMIKESDNYLGVIPVFHAANLMNAFKWFGDSDLVDTWLINQARNSAINSIKKIIEYHAEPTTVLIGASAQNVEVGAKRLWSIRKDRDKVDIKVLGLDSDLAASNTYVDNLRKAMMELASMPEHAFGADIAISNTSAAALEVKYMCLLEKTKRKRISYGRALLQMCKLIAQMIIVQNPTIVKKLRYPERYQEFAINFANPLPRDMIETLKVESEKLRLGIQSKHGALKYVDPKDMESKMVEIIADARETMLTEVERARGSAGGVPNIHAPWTGSLGMYVDKNETFRREDELILRLQKSLTETQKVIDSDNQNMLKQEEESGKEPAKNE